MIVDDERPAYVYRVYAAPQRHSMFPELLYVGHTGVARPTTTALHQRIYVHRCITPWWRSEAWRVEGVRYERAADARRAEALAIATEAPKYNIRLTRALQRRRIRPVPLSVQLWRAPVDPEDLGVLILDAFGRRVELGQETPWR